MGRDPISNTLIDRIGPALVRERFGPSTQLLYMWRVRGVPLNRRIAFYDLAIERGIQPPPEFLQPLCISASPSADKGGGLTPVAASRVFNKVADLKNAET